jgi:hypothetical protein
VLGKPSKRLKKRLEESGVRAQAKVLEVAERGMAVTNGAEGIVANTTLAVKCRLEVTPPDGTPPFEVHERFRFSQFAVPSAGQMLAVIYDPEDHDKVMLDESAEASQNAMLASAGIDPAMIEQALQATQEARAAQGFDPIVMPGAGMGAPQQPAAPDPIALLEKLQALREKGALTDAEFETQKARILGG